MYRSISYGPIFERIKVTKHQINSPMVKISIIYDVLSLATTDHVLLFLLVDCFAVNVFWSLL